MRDAECNNLPVKDISIDRSIRYLHIKDQD